MGVYFVIRSNIDRGSSMKVGSTTLLRSAPGRSCEMIWESTKGGCRCLAETPYAVELDEV